MNFKLSNLHIHIYVYVPYVKLINQTNDSLIRGPPLSYPPYFVLLYSDINEWPQYQKSGFEKNQTCIFRTCKTPQHFNGRQDLASPIFFSFQDIPRHIVQQYSIVTIIGEKFDLQVVGIPTYSILPYYYYTEIAWGYLLVQYSR